MLPSHRAWQALPLACHGNICPNVVTVTTLLTVSGILLLQALRKWKMEFLYTSFREIFLYGQHKDQLLFSYNSEIEIMMNFYIYTSFCEIFPYIQQLFFNHYEIEMCNLWIDTFVKDFFYNQHKDELLFLQLWDWKKEFAKTSFHEIRIYSRNKDELLSLSILNLKSVISG